MKLNPTELAGRKPESVDHPARNANEAIMAR